MSESPGASSSTLTRPETPPASTKASLTITAGDFLSYPSAAAEAVPETASSNARKDVNAPPEKKKLLKDRLYVGNLHPTVDEYSLITLFSKFGTITSLDYLFHKTGPSKGKPRGFAFVEFAEPATAQKALSALHDKIVRGRKLVVTYAHHAPTDLYASSGIGVQGGKVEHRFRKGMMDSAKPTTLSLLKTGRGDGSNSKDMITRMEAKLRQMEASSLMPTSSSAESTSLHPSLPQKPPVLSTNASSQPNTNTNIHSSSTRRDSSKPHRAPLPSLAIIQSQGQAQARAKPTSDFASSLSSAYTPSVPIPPVTGQTTPNSSVTKVRSIMQARPQAQSRGSGLGLAGVKIVRKGG